MSKFILAFCSNLKYDIIYEDCEGFKSVFTRVANFIEDIKNTIKIKQF